MNKVYIIFAYIFIIILNTNNLQAAPNSTATVNCEPSLQKHLEAILKIPEAKNLLNTIRKEGSIHIVAGNSPLAKRFGAFWDPDQRAIFIDTARSEGSIIGSLIFELHNASVDSHFNYLNEMAHQGRISKEKYIESMEYMEYINSKNASKLASTVIKMRVLPKDAFLPTYDNFKEHLQAQKQSGHSDCFARNFDNCHYRPF
jgi:hypothetical protein